MPPVRALQLLLIGAFALTAVICAAAGIHGYQSALRFMVNGVPLRADVLAEVKSINGLDMLPARPAENVFSGAQQNLWKQRNRDLHNHLASREQVTLKFDPRTPHKETVVAQLSPWSKAALFEQLGWPYLAAALHIVLAVYALCAFPSHNGFLVALACAGLGLLYTALGIPPPLPLTVAPDVVPLIHAGVLFGLFGVIALLHFLLRAPMPVLHPVLVQCIVYGLYAYLAIKIALLLTGEFGAATLMPFVFVVGGLLCAAAIFSMVRKDRRDAAHAARVYTWPVALGAIILAALLVAQPASTASIQLLIVFGLLVPFGMVANMNAQQDRSEKRSLKHSLRNERELIRRELHDGLLNDLAAIAITAERLQHSTELRSPPMAQRLEILNTLTNDAATRIRTLLKTTSNDTRTWEDFFASVATYANVVLNASGVRLTSVADPALATLPVSDDMQLVNLEHVCREAVVNVLKHSGATEVSLHAHSDGSAVLIDIDDNGCGYQQANRVSEGFGTTHMNRRMTEAGGTVHIGPAPDQGTRVRLRVPVAHAAPRDKTSLPTVSSQ